MDAPEPASGLKLPELSRTLASLGLYRQCRDLKPRRNHPVCRIGAGCMRQGFGGWCGGGVRAVGCVLVTGALVTTTAMGEPASLSSDDLRQLASGKTVHLESPYGTLPVSFKPDGTLSGKASGALATYLGSTSDRGRWTVQGDRICQKFFKWFAGEMHCMRVRQEGRRIHWRRDDGLTGTATVSANDTPPFEKPAALGAPVEETAQVPAKAEPPAAQRMAVEQPRADRIESPPRFAEVGVDKCEIAPDEDCAEHR